MRFEALEHSLRTIELLRPLVARLVSRDPKLADQIRRAAASVALNLGEGNCRRGRDRNHQFRTASGSTEEVRVALRVAEAWGDLSPEDVREALEALDRVKQLIHGLLR